MKTSIINLTFSLVGFLAIFANLGSTPKATGRECNYYAGESINGESINLNLCSIDRINSKYVNFVYYLGQERVESQANCENWTWTTFPEEDIHSPQSQATENMMNVVCYGEAGPEARLGFVFAPPSNVRVYPNGEVLCVVTSPITINIYGSTGEWYYTDVCGETGVIHSSQIRF